MKRLLLFLIPLSIIVSCGSEDSTKNEVPVSKKGSWIDSDKDSLKSYIEKEILSDIKKIKDKDKGELIEKYSKDLENNFPSFSASKKDKSGRKKYLSKILDEKEISMKGLWCNKDKKKLEDDFADARPTWKRSVGAKKTDKCFECLIDKCEETFYSYKDAMRSRNRANSVMRKCFKAAGIR